MPMEFAPPLSRPEDVVQVLTGRGFVVTDPAGLAELTGVSLPELAALAVDWNDLPVDAYLRDGGHYRRRRHASFVVTGASCEVVPHRAHFQPPEYNALHGGMERWFEPMRAAVVERPAWHALVKGLARVCSAARGERPWYVEAHQFRIDTAEGIGRPTPEGAHRDGVDFVALILVGRSGIKGGETRVFDAHGPNGIRFSLTLPWSALLLDDSHVIHESTPIQPLHTTPGGEANGHRDTLVLTFRAGGFQHA